MYKVLIAVSTLILTSPALAQFTSDSDGSDGAFMPGGPTYLVDLSLAPTGPWDTTPHAAGVGVYDPVQWAVVFQYTTIDIPAGVTVTFHNHLKGPPVIWLATGDVTIAGDVVLDGANGCFGAGCSYATPGPGGFSGGIGSPGGRSAGFGPGGGGFNGLSGGGGGYGTGGQGQGGVIYGTATIVPLIGGSGGGWGVAGGLRSGGAGGGAILIASSGNIFLDSFGGIFATGGDAACCNEAGGGSGGGIRLITNTISGSGMLRALGGTGGVNIGGDGRIRVEAKRNMLVDPGDPLFTTGLPGSVFPDATGPTLRVTAVNGVPVPADPLATVVSPDVCFISAGLVTIDIEAQNVPVGLAVTVRIVDALGGFSQVVTSTPLAGTLVLSTATADATFIDGASEVQLSVQVP
ncbi:MAG: hypothetical protein IH830_09515 [Planctomycetes bacterium]|nr:hypothetical protein [Planctomycetota bacterium]